MNIARALEIAKAVPDPEIPVITLGDLGVIRGATIDGDALIIQVSPTYSGCPATSLINEMILEALAQNHMTNAKIETLLSPPWSTDWISREGRQKLEAYGIAPPNPEKSKPTHCPMCKATNVQKLSEFGSTPCQALWKCDSCLEVFNYFKCI